MTTICDQQAINEVLAALACPFQVTERIRLAGYTCVHDANYENTRVDKDFIAVKK